MVPEESAARTPLHTLEQERAKLAWSQVTEASAERLGDNYRNNYRSVVRKAPAMVKINGLGQFLAFLLAKAGESAREIEEPRNTPSNPEGLLYRHVATWLVSSQSPVRLPPGDSFMERVISADSRIYRHATGETLAYLGWLKRFAEACYGTRENST